mmetsp:Transcript_92958/g.277430  ORF Transcript_92958/g.277430 Transcript_92958/m.277430 type:complete len:220 (-) Transcript_92958:813-1472(-)
MAYCTCVWHSSLGRASWQMWKGSVAEASCRGNVSLGARLLGSSRTNTYKRKESLVGKAVVFSTVLMPTARSACESPHTPESSGFVASKAPPTALETISSVIAHTAVSSCPKACVASTRRGMRPPLSTENRMPGNRLFPTSTADMLGAGFFRRWPVQHSSMMATVSDSQSGHGTLMFCVTAGHSLNMPYHVPVFSHFQPQTNAKEPMQSGSALQELQVAK